MLDQNTDRMWYVIGAVIVGAALIFLVNSSFPQLFASVGDTFKHKTDDVGETISDIKLMENQLGSDTLTFYPTVNNETLNKDTDTWSFTYNPTLNGETRKWAVTFTDSHSVYVPYGSTFHISYEIYVDEDTILYSDVNNYPVDKNKEDLPLYSVNDHDDFNNRVIQGRKGNMYTIPLKGKEWTTIRMSYINKSIYNTNKAALRDASRFGFIKLDNTLVDRPVDVQLRNIMGYTAG